ncbi:MAG: hypothetical protein M1822_005426 [Bathelium mastoideum]|nr:MAG: hypothetical protein M1822_005426 [Bathelium mastoideum]
MATPPLKCKRRLEDDSIASPASSRRKIPKLASDYFEVRDILQYKNGLYLVDWEDNPDTGEKYNPTWEPKKNLNQKALVHWEQNQVEQRRQRKESERLKSAKRKTESQQSYGETGSSSVRARPLKRRIINTSPITGGFVAAEARYTAGDRSAIGPVTRSAQTSSQISSTTSDTGGAQGKSNSPSTEPASSAPQSEFREEEPVHQTTWLEPEVLLSQKSIDSAEYTSFSLSATQESATSSVNSTHVHSQALDGRLNKTRKAAPGESSSRDSSAINSQSAKADTQESVQVRSAPNFVSERTGGVLQGSISDSPPSRLSGKWTKQPSPRSARQIGISAPLAGSNHRFDQASSQNSVDSEPSTNQRPPDESYIPAPSVPTQTATESRAETTATDSLQQHTPFREDDSASLAKVVPDSHVLESDNSFVPPEHSSNTGDNSTDKSRTLAQDRNQDIPESSPLQSTNQEPKSPLHTPTKIFVSSSSEPEAALTSKSHSVAKQRAGSKRPTAPLSLPAATGKTHSTGSINQQSQRQGDTVLSIDNQDATAIRTAFSNTRIQDSGTQATETTSKDNTRALQQDSSQGKSSIQAMETQLTAGTHESETAPELSAPFDTAPEIAHIETTKDSVQHDKDRGMAPHSQQPLTNQTQQSQQNNLALDGVHTQDQLPSSNGPYRSPRLSQIGQLSVSSLPQPPTETGESPTTNALSQLEASLEPHNLPRADQAESFDVSELEARLSQARQRAISNPAQPQFKFRPRRRKSSLADIASSEGPTRSPSAIPHAAPEPKAPEPSATRSTMLATLLPGELHEPASVSQEALDAQATHDDDTKQVESQGHPSNVQNTSGTSKLDVMTDEVVKKPLPTTDVIETANVRPGPRPHAGEEFVLALPMGGSQRDSHNNRIKNAMKAASNPLSAFVGNPQSTARAEVLAIVETLHDILLHTDLEHREILSQEVVADWKIAKWAETSSIKFKFLGDLIRSYNGPPREIAIFIKPGLAYDIAMSFFKGSNVTTYSDLAGHEPVTQGERALAVRVYSTQSPPPTLPQQLLIVIGLDHTFDPNFVKSHFAGSKDDAAGNLPPSVRLLVANSVEQFERWLPQEIEVTERLQTLVQAISQFKTMCGIVPNDYPLARTAEVTRKLDILVSNFARFLENTDVGMTWPELEMLPQFEAVLKPHISSTDGESSDQQLGDSPSLKRSMASSDNGQQRPAKRMRQSPAGKARLSASTIVNPSDPTTTHVTNSAEHAQPSVAQEQKVVKKEGSPTHSEKRAELRRLQSSNLDILKAMESLQTRYEEQRAGLTKAYHDLDSTKQTLERVEKRLDIQSQTIASLRTDRAALQTDLDAARAALLDSSTTSLSNASSLAAALETARAEARTHQSAVTALQKRADATAVDLDYIRTQYQSASSTAAALAAEVAQLRDANARLAPRADGQAARAREMHLDRHAEATASENKRLKQQLNDREQLLRRKEAEIRALGEKVAAGRPQVMTRAGSAAPGAGGSPRLGAVDRGARAGRVVAPGSRGVSPAPGIGGQAMERVGSRGGGGGGHPLRKG